MQKTSKRPIQPTPRSAPSFSATPAPPDFRPTPLRFPLRSHVTSSLEALKFYPIVSVLPQCFIPLVLRITSFLHKGSGDQTVNLIKTELVSYQSSTSPTLFSSSHCVSSTNRHFNTILFCTFVQFYNKHTHGIIIHSNTNQPKKLIII